ncbi:MAG: hypothetical protein NUV60_00090 [Patescibacteria group bacterium]|nr:hypothetical protein [Patescibacteria group bacterium]
MEHPPPKGPDSSGSEAEQLSAKEKVEQVLSLFGTDETRAVFVQKCRNYIKARDRAIHESYSPQAFIRHRAAYSSPKQAVIHNEIMDTITRISNQAPNVSPQQRKTLIEMHDRDVTADIIRKYLASIGEAPLDDEEENGERKGGMSDTAYYHSLNKGG